FLRNFRASSSVASSAAALVGERVIVPHQRNSQHTKFKKIQKLYKLLKIKGNFDDAGSCLDNPYKQTKSGGEKAGKSGDNIAWPERRNRAYR
ncbi:hypothetical protein, partial [Rhizobium sp. Root268]